MAKRRRYKKVKITLANGIEYVFNELAKECKNGDNDEIFRQSICLDQFFGMFVHAGIAYYWKWFPKDGKMPFLKRLLHLIFTKCVESTATYSIKTVFNVVEPIINSMFYGEIWDNQDYQGRAHVLAIVFDIINRRMGDVRLDDLDNYFHGLTLGSVVCKLFLSNGNRNTISSNLRDALHHENHQIQLTTAAMIQFLMRFIRNSYLRFGNTIDDFFYDGMGWRLVQYFTEKASFRDKFQFAVLLEEYVYYDYCNERAPLYVNDLNE